MANHYRETVPPPVKEAEIHQVVKCYQREFRWVIENFLQNYRNDSYNYYEKSPYFHVGKDVPPRKMFLSLYPTDRSRADSFSINLNLEGSAPLQADLKIGLQRADGTLARCKSYNQLLLGGTGMGCPKILTVALDGLLDFLPNETLRVVCCINIFEKWSSCKRKWKCLNQEVNDTQEKKAKTTKYMISQLLDNFTDFNADPRQAARFADFKVNADGKTFDCHKVFLALRSDVFSAMFEHNLTESQQNEVTITDMDSSTVGNMLNFIYTDTVKDDSITPELLAAANKYDIPLLRQTCEDSLLGRLSIHNAADIWLAFNLHASKHSQDILLKFLAEFWSKVHILTFKYLVIVREDRIALGRYGHFLNRDVS